MRRAGIGEWRPGGGGNILAEPVLLCLSEMLSDLRGQIYDQHGKLLAFSKWRQSDSHARFGKRFRSFNTVDLLDIGGRTQLSLSKERDRWGPTLFKAAAPDGTEIGGVTVARKERGSIVAAGRIVGWVKPAPGGLLGRLSLGRNRDRYIIYDAADGEVGRITHRTRWWSTYNVIELDDRAPDPFRALALAAAAAVDKWLEPKGGGG
ncbi:MAG TPA: hypothetical protein VGW98_02965 [Solirubrobacteraceae bacterium]|nr:hypothetical protein [Solirubrobacteraceae bacterium]